MIEDTLTLLASEGRPMTIAELVEKLPPVHDLETLALWLGLAREAGIDIQDINMQEVALVDEEQQQWLFRIPWVALSSEALDGIEWEF